MITSNHVSGLIFIIPHLFNNSFSDNTSPTSVLASYILATCHGGKGNWPSSPLFPQLPSCFLSRLSRLPLAPPGLKIRNVDVQVRSDVIDLNVTLAKLPLDLVDSVLP